MLTALPSFLLALLALLPLALSSPDLTAAPQHDAIQTHIAQLDQRAPRFRFNDPKPDAPEVTSANDSPYGNAIRLDTDRSASGPSTSYDPNPSSTSYLTQSSTESQVIEGPQAAGARSTSTSSSGSTTATVAATSTVAIAGAGFTGAGPMLAAPRANSALAMWLGISALCLLAY